MESMIDKAERLGQRRARLLPVLAILLITQQGAFLSGQHEAMRSVDWVSLGGWLILTGAVLALLATGGSLLRSAELRGLLNDETTQANRRSALAAGFIVTIATAMVCYAVSFFDTVEVRKALHVVVTTGLAGALLRFSALERRAYRDA